MSAPTIAEITFEIGQILRRSVWQPIRWAMGIFHLLPGAAAVVLLLLLFEVGQTREIYLSYLEDLDVGRILWALLGFSLISAAFHVTHYWLSTMRINVVYAGHSQPDVGINLLRLQRVAAFVWTFFPWAGLVMGLFSTRSYLFDARRKLCDASIPPDKLQELLALPAAGPGAVAASAIVLGLVVGALFDFYRGSRRAQAAIVVMTPALAGGAFVLLSGFWPSNAVALDIFVAGLIACGAVFYRNDRIVQSVLLLLPLSAGAAVIMSLTQFGQAQAYSTVLLVATLIVATAVFCRIHYLLDRTRIGFAYSAVWHADTGIDVRKRRRLVTLFWVLLPWVVVGFYFLRDFLQPGNAVADLSPFVCSPGTAPRIDAWPIVHVAMIGVVTVGLAVTSVMDALGQHPRTQKIIAATIFAAICVAVAMPLFGFDMVRDFRIVGPFGSMTLAFLFIFSVFTVLALLSQRSGFPGLAFAFGAIIIGSLFNVSIAMTAVVLASVCLVLVVVALLSRLWSVAAVVALLGAIAILTILRSEYHYVDALKQVTADTSVADLENRFSDWVSNRADRKQGPGSPENPYPVFIVSAQGGGIYAATAASLFLAKLQDDCPGFAQHVFAISAVSGGAIGATVFQAYSQTVGEQRSVECKVQGDSKLDAEQKAPRVAAKANATQAVAEVMRQDHLSPVVASIVPDFLGESYGRAEALEQSFEEFGDSDASREIKYRLQDPFLAHWFNASVGPALVLNATWAETGYRAVFAPFTLHWDNNDSAPRVGAGGEGQPHAGVDGTLYSFADARFPDEYEIPLMRAAVVSARFPGILPPFTVKTGDHSWNFVDGGYSDWSGAATALSLFEALQKRSCVLNVDLRLIVLTDTDPQPNFRKLTGSEFRDTMAPVEAVLNVRELLGSQAVTRAVDYFKSPRPCSDQQSAPEWQLQKVELAGLEYSLPLGWKLSKTTFGLVSYLINPPGRCARQEPQPNGASSSATVQASAQDRGVLSEDASALENNRCAVHKIEHLFDTQW